MVVIPTVTGLSTGARLLSVPRTLATVAGASPSSRPSLCHLKKAYYPLQRRSTLPARKLVIRAARTESKGVSLGFRAPNFELPEPLTGKVWKLDDFEAYPALLVMFICNHCPFVIHLKKDIVKLSNFYMKKGLAVVAISSNSVITHPQDGPEFMAEEAKLFNMLWKCNCVNYAVEVQLCKLCCGSTIVELLRLARSSPNSIVFSTHELLYKDEVFNTLHDIHKKWQEILELFVHQNFSCSKRMAEGPLS